MLLFIIKWTSYRGVYSFQSLERITCSQSLLRFIISTAGLGFNYISIIPLHVYQWLHEAFTDVFHIANVINKEVLSTWRHWLFQMFVPFTPPFGMLICSLWLLLVFWISTVCLFSGPFNNYSLQIWNGFKIIWKPRKKCRWKSIVKEIQLYIVKLGDFTISFICFWWDFIFLQLRKNNNFKMWDFTREKRLKPGAFFS